MTKVFPFREIQFSLKQEGLSAAQQTTVVHHSGEDFTQLLDKVALIRLFVEVSRVIQLSNQHLKLKMHHVKSKISIKQALMTYTVFHALPPYGSSKVNF